MSLLQRLRRFRRPEPETHTCPRSWRAWFYAQAIEARRAETQSGSVHESAVGNADAP